jgi:hypothetical protein
MRTGTLHALLKELRRAHTEQQQLADSLHVAVQFLEASATGHAARTNGNGAHAAVLEAAIALDKTRRLGPPPDAPRPRQVRDGAATKARHARRKASEKLLARFDAKTPRTAQTVGLAFAYRYLSPLVRWGYLARSGDGYVRTTKAFTP